MAGRVHGQLLVDIAGLSLTKEDMEILKHPRTSGLVLFTRNFKDSKQLRSLCDSIHTLRDDLIIAVDQEGGRVQRFVGDEFEVLPPVSHFGEQSKTDLQSAMAAARKHGKTMAGTLINHGIDVSFAPVLDCDPCVEGGVLSNRCFDAKPEVIIRLAANYINGMADEGMLAIGKHFPGHGGVIEDTHTELATDPRSLEALMVRDILPYVALQSALQGIMLSHVCFPSVDPSPCSLSKKWIDIIRKTMELPHVLLTDCLSMAGVAKVFPNPVQRVNAAFDAGVDLALLCNDRPAVEQVLMQLPSTTSYELHRRLSEWRATVQL